MSSPVKYKPTLRERIDDVIYGEFGEGFNPMTPGTRLAEDLGSDDLTIVELTLALEDEFDLPVIEDPDNLIFVQDVYDLVEKSLGGKGARA